jgi:hypothetical protein
MANRAAIASMQGAKVIAAGGRRLALTRRLHQGVATIYYRGRHSQGPPLTGAAALKGHRAREL